jgi:type I restriction enzyme S subunit
MHKLPSGWRMVSLRDLALASGKYGSGSAALEYDPALPRYVRITDIHERGVLSSSKLASIGYANAKPYMLKSGDLLFARSGATVGKTLLYRESDGPCAHAGYVIKFSINEKLALPAYVAYWTQGAAYWSWVRQTMRQAAQPNINAIEYAGHKIALPPRVEQQRIVEILDSLEDQLRLRGRVIEKLRAKSAGLVETMLARVVADPAALVNHLAFPPRNGFSPKESDEWTGLQALGLGCLTRNGFEPRQLKNVPLGEVRASSALLNEGDLLMSRANTRELVGLVGRYRDVGTPCIYPDLMMRLVVQPGCRSEFLELVLRSANVRRQIQALSQGTSESMVKISGASVRRLLVNVPELVEQNRILAISDEAKREIEHEIKERDKLSLIRGGLMDDLLAGRVRTPG